jgi:plastocyanin
MRVKVAAAVAILLCVALFGVACGGGGSSAASSGATIPTPAVQGTPTDSLELDAKDLKYNVDEITLKPNTQATITLNNEDDGVLHNFSIYTSTDASTTVFKGDLTTGPDTATYTIPPLKPGTYYFRCDVHPDTMHGTLVVPAAQ